MKVGDKNDFTLSTSNFHHMKMHFFLGIVGGTYFVEAPKIWKSSYKALLYEPSLLTMSTFAVNGPCSSVVVSLLKRLPWDEMQMRYSVIATSVYL